MLGKARTGCYSIKYQDPTDSDWQFAIDYDWQSDLTKRKTAWTCSESPIFSIHWTGLHIIPEHSLQPMLDHFGLTKDDLGSLLCCIYDMSPCTLIQMRREKERYNYLEQKVVKNMRIGCSSNELLPENF